MPKFNKMSIKEFNEEFKRKVKEDDMMSDKDFKKDFNFDKLEKMIK